MKKMILILLLSPIWCIAQKNITFVLDAGNIGKKSTCQVEGRVLSKQIKPDKTLFVILVRHNSTFRVKVKQKSLFDAIREREYITLTNLTIE